MSARDSAAVWLLALGLLLIYSGALYAFPAMLPALEAETGWGKPALALGPTLGALTMAALTPVTGRVVDAGLGGRMMVALPPLAALGMLGLALARTPWEWGVAWMVIGAAEAGCVYETSFSLLTRKLGLEARGAIVRITLVAGLASTLTFPLGHSLSRAMGGQAAFVVFAGLALLGTLPLYALAMRFLGPDVGEVPARAEDGSALAAALRRPAFWGLAAIFAMSWLDHGMFLTYILPLFHDRGASAEMATLAAACIGPAQLAGRFVMVLGGSRIRNATATWLSLGLVVAAAGILIAAGVAPGLVFVVVAAQGAGVGLLSIMRPMLIAEVLGRRGFGAISGMMAMAPIIAMALAPSLGAQLLAIWGPAGIYAGVAGFSVASLALAVAMLRRPVAFG